MPNVLLIGWDGADWRQIHPLLDAGEMPNLARLVEHGVMGDLAGLAPPVSPPLWTSIATGVYADRHGVLDSHEPDPVTGGIRPATRSSLRSTQIWDILAREGFESRVVSWPVTHPASAPATCVSDGFFYRVPRSIRPDALEATLAPLRFDPQEFTADELQFFVPQWRKVDQDKDKGLARLAVLLAQAVTTHAVATTLIESAAAAFTAVWFGAVAQACAAFPDSGDEIYGGVVSGVYRFLDRLLGRLVELAGTDATVMLVSDRAAAAGAPRGLFCAAGPGIQADELAFGGGLLDIAPTVLALFGLAAASCMPGRAIPEVCAAAPTRTVAEYGEFAAAPPPDVAGIAELEDAGYVDAVAAQWREEAESARRRREFHLARVLIAQARYAEAVPLLERLGAEEPSAADVRLYLAYAYYQASRLEDCRRICEELLTGIPNSQARPAAEAFLAMGRGDLAAARKYLDSASEGYGMAAAVDAAIGWAHLHVESWQEAAAAFRSAIASDPGMASAREGLARALLADGRHAEAAEAALDAIRLRYDCAPYHQVLSAALEGLGRRTAAAEAFAISERLRGRSPAA